MLNSKQLMNLTLLSVGVVAYIIALWLRAFDTTGQVIGLGILIAYALVVIPRMRRAPDPDAPGELHLRSK